MLDINFIRLGKATHIVSSPPIDFKKFFITNLIVKKESGRVVALKLVRQNPHV